MPVDVSDFVDADDDTDAFTLGAGRATRECPECGEVGVYVSAFGIPLAGPIQLDGFDVCLDDRGAFYHRESEETEEKK